jgi:putative phosphoribosyl transferase
VVDMAEHLASLVPLFADRREAGRQLAESLERERKLNPVVVGLARGGVQVAAEVARALEAPLDVVAVRKVGHPWQPEYAIGAVTPGEGVYVRESDGLTEEQLTELLARTSAKAAALDRRLHAEHPALDLKDRTVLVVDDGFATGATMIAALRWARAAGAERVVAAVPVAPSGSIELVSTEADEVVCPHVLDLFFAVGAWYRSFEQLDDVDVIRLIEENRREPKAAADPVRATRELR